ncbi:MAG: hypothetical protein V1806_04500 [Pseudomonadota bacterium]
MAAEDPLIINEAQLILAEKRTHLAALRTGIAIVALPMAFISFLIAASQLYLINKVLWLLLPLLVVCTGLGLLGVYMIVKSVIKLRHAEKMLRQLKLQHSMLCQFMD